MSVRVDDLTKSITKHGTLSPNAYVVSIKMPPQFIGSGRKAQKNFDEDLAPRIQRITLPEREMSVIEQKSAYRESRSIPKGYSPFGNLSMSILLSENFREKRMLMGWQDYIINPKHNFNPSYLDSITTTITVTTLADPGGTKRDRARGVIHRFYECYPINVGDVELSYSTTDEAATLDASFAYNYYTLDAGPDFGDSVKSVTGTDSIGDVKIAKKEELAQDIFGGR